MKLNVNEIFYSLQGEGVRAGIPSIFIRLSDCNLTCGFCDTEFTSFQELSLEEIHFKIIDFPCHTIIWTGGEPSLQLTPDIVQFFKDRNYYQCIETNGTKRLPENLDFVTLSPKVAEHILEKNFPHRVNEIKYVRHSGHQSLPETNIIADHYYISPQCDGNNINQKNLDHCIKLILTQNKWKLTLQYHKVWKIL